MSGYGRHPRRQNPDADTQPLAFHGLWDGVVVDDKDPEKLGRVKVRIYELHDETVPVSEIPWAMPNFPASFTHLSDLDRNGGFFHIPPVDSLVNVMFRRGDPEKPVWMGGWHPSAECIKGREGYQDHQKRTMLYNGPGIPSCPTWATLRGFRIEMDEEVAELRVTTPKGHKITCSDLESNEHGDCIKLEDHKGNYFWMHSGIDELHIYWNGDCFEHITGNYHRQVDGNEIRYVTGNVSEKYDAEHHRLVAGNSNVDAAVINHNCGLAAPEPVIKPEPGTASGGDVIGRVLEALGNQIRKIAAGG